MLLGPAKLEKRASVILVPKKSARSSLAWLRNDDAMAGYVSNPDLLSGERSASQSHASMPLTSFRHRKVNKNFGPG